MNIKTPNIHTRSITLVGLMGVGKTTIGRKLAKKMNRPFVDSDIEIEKAAGQSISDYFIHYGETEFRKGEYRVIKRILNQSGIVLATGGGAFINAKIREEILQKSLTIWLKGDLNILMQRVNRNKNRPLLNMGNPRQKMQDLMDERYPVYAKAHICVDVTQHSPIHTVEEILAKGCHYDIGQ